MKNAMIVILVLVFGLAFGQSAQAMSKPQSQKVAKVSKSVNASKIQTVNLNTAGAKELAEMLKGVGQKKAEAIVAYRKKHGDFNKIEELASVKGIGIATITKNEKIIVLK